ncbi:MAG TPA: ABC transporter permease [Gaiellaceae bacterium]|nr:ABC transporter permease [Gaiellaceae bacterium]
MDDLDVVGGVADPYGEAAALPTSRRSARAQAVALSVVRSPTGVIGLILISITVGIAIFGPLFAPYNPTAVVGTPFEPPSSAHLLGTDFLGRDALSRVLAGGLTVLVVALLSTMLAYLVAVPAGMLAGLRRRADLVVTPIADLVLSFPSIVFVLVLLAATGPVLWVVVVGIAISHMPRITRIVRSATADIVALEYIEAAVARGESAWSIVRRDVLPNIATPLLTDVGLRFTFSVLLYSSLAYLGLGRPPPAADWGGIINENQLALTYRPLVCVVPAILIALMAVGGSLIADALARTIGRSVVGRAG